MMLHKTRAIVLRTTRYGETSLVVTMLTERFGLQTYLVNGVRTNKKNHGKASMYQPAALLELEAYHHTHKNMQRIKSTGWAVMYRNMFSDVIKNCIVLFMVELLQKSILQPEENPELFYFCEEACRQLDHADPAVAANFPLYFSLSLSHYFGFGIASPAPGLKKADSMYLDLQNGYFVADPPVHPYYLENEYAKISAALLQIRQPEALKDIKMNQHRRRELLQKYMLFYALHIPGFSEMKTLKVMYEIGLEAQ